MKLDELRDWEEEHDEVEKDVGPSVDVRGCFDIDAVAFVFAVPGVPEMAYGLALEGEVDDKGQTVCD